MIYEHVKNCYRYEIIDETETSIKLRQVKTQKEISMPKITFGHYFKLAISRYTCPVCGYTIKAEQKLKLICETCDSQLNEKFI